MMNNTDDICTLITNQLKNEPGIVCAYLFGSITEGYYNENSDIDLAVLFKNNIDFEQELALAIKLQDKLKRNVDLINLNRAGINLAFRAISRGILIYEDDEIAHADFLEKLFKQYHDFRPIYEKLLREFQQAL